MEEIKDQQRLFQKLFISPSTSSPNPHLILSIQFLKLLLEQARFLSTAAQRPFLLKILGLFEIQPANSLMLYHHDSLGTDQGALLTEIVLTCARTVRNREDGEEYLGMIDALLAYYPIGMAQVASITKEFALQFQEGKFAAGKARFLHRVLEKYYGPKCGLRGMPQSFFFFYGQGESSTIHSFQDIKIKIRNQISVIFSFYLLDKPQRDMTICTIKTNKEQLCIKVGKSISALNLTTKQRATEQQTIKPQTWYRVIVSLSPNETVIFLNDEEVARQRPIIRKQKERDILEYAFGQELFGFMTGVVVSHRMLSQEIVEEMPDFKSWYDIGYIRKQGLQEVFIFSCFPYSTFEMRDNSNCFDIFQKIHSQIGENIILFRNFPQYAGLLFMGGLEILLPLFYLARFYSVEEYPDHLVCLLKIWHSSLVLFPNTQKNQNFLLILGHHLEALPHLLTSESVAVISQLYQKQSMASKISFLRYIAWSGLHGRTNGPVTLEWLNWLTRIYQNSKSLCLQAFGLLDVVYWLVIHLQNGLHNCCPQHYLSEARVLREFSLEEMVKLQSCSRRMHFQAAQNIAAVILEYYIIDQHKSAVKDIRGILRLLLHKYSTCLYRTILRIFKRQFPKFKDDRALSLFFQEVGLLPFLAALAEKTVDAGLLSLIAYLLLTMSSFRENGKNEAIDFLVVVFRRMNDIYQQHFSPLAHGAKKIRKRSEDTQKRQGYSDLIQRMGQYREDMNELAIVLLNFCVGHLADGEISRQSRITGDQEMYLLRCFMPLAGSDTRTFIIEALKSKLQENASNYDYCVRSIQFNELILCGLRQGRQKERSAVKRMLVLLFLWQIENKMIIGEYYTFLKTLGRSQIDMAEVLYQVFAQILTRSGDVTLYYLQIIQLIITAEHQHEGSEGRSASELYFSVVGILAVKIVSCLKKQLHLQDKTGEKVQGGRMGVNMLKVLKNVSDKQLEIELFRMEINLVAEENINFLFDIFLPKSIAGHNIQSLFYDTKRRVYTLEILVWVLMDYIHESQQKQQVVIESLIQILKMYIGVSLVRPEAEVDKSFMRMILFLTSYSLCFSSFKQQFLQLWLWMLKLTKAQIKQLKATSYLDLIQKLSLQQIQPYIIQLFQTFLRPNNQQYLLPFHHIIDQDQQTLNKFIHSTIVPILSLPAFQYATIKCKQLAYHQMLAMFSERVRALRAKLDVQTKRNSDQRYFKQVQKLFQSQSVGEEQTRLRYLHEHQCSIRDYHSKWKKVWKRLRIYHHPYALFMAQKDSPTHFDFTDSTHKNFKFKISKFSSDSGIQPILQAQILQPWHVRKSIKRDGRNQLSSLVQMTRPTHNPRKREGNISELANKFMRTLRGETTIQEAAEYQVIWIKRGRKARGKLLISDNWELVFWYDSLRQEDCHLSFERFSLPYDKPIIKRWRVDLIRSIGLRRYLMQWHALEIELVYKKSLLFFFCDGRQAHFLQEIQQMRTSRMQAYGQKLKLNKVNLYSDEWYTQGMSPLLTQNWLNRKVSTLSYLIAVNRAASRNILDVSQYPVAPWVCQMSQQKQPSLRDLSKTMGGLGNEDRKKIVTEKYMANDPFNPVPPFFFGTHYSSPGVVFNYLIRLAPFTDYCKNLQGGKFDIADRLFASLITAWKSASNQVSDVREMIPEFYYLPECLLNLERLHFGATQGGEQVNHVELPPWAGGNPYFLTVQLRQMLESETVAANLPAWLDLIFGRKQKGRQAVQNYNVYYYLTYEDYSNCLDNHTDQVYRKSCEAQIIHFGQIPPQIFDEAQVRRTEMFKPPTELVVRERLELMNTLTQRPIGLCRSSPTELTLIRRNEIQTLVLGKSPAVMTKSIEFNLERTITKKLYNLKKESARTIFFGKYFIVYGYVTHQFRFFHRSNGTLQFDDNVDSRIESAIVNIQESLLLIGCQSGLLHIYEIQYQASRIACKKMLSLPFPHPVTHISQHDGFFAVSFGCFVAIYKIQRSLSFLSKQNKPPFVRFFRSFRNTLPVKGAFISDAPLYCLFLFDNAHAKVYSINGQFIRSFSCSPRSVQRMRDSELNSLFCVHQEGRLLLLSTPDLRCVSELEIKGELQVVAGAVIYKREVHLIDCGNV